MLFNSVFFLGGINLIVFINCVIFYHSYFIHLSIPSFHYVTEFFVIVFFFYYTGMITPLDNDIEISTKTNDIKS